MDRKKVGEELARKAGKILMEYFGKENIEKGKGERDHVLDVDFEAEKLIINTLQERFPDDSILSEEADDIVGSSDYRWVVDPLDGTLNFKSRISYFCVSIALEEKGELVMAFVCDPIKDKFYFAEKGKGAFVNGEKMKVSSTEHLIKFLISYSTSNHKDLEVVKLGAKSFKNLLDNCRAIRLRGSSILDLCNLAEGIFDGLVKVGANYWDFAAGSLIVEEAGGKVTDFTGQHWDSKSENLFASNGLHHSKLLEVLKE